jgi:hypothetical protein
LIRVRDELGGAVNERSSEARKTAGFIAGSGLLMSVLSAVLIWLAFKDSGVAAGKLGFGVFVATWSVLLAIALAVDTLPRGEDPHG